MSPYESRCFLAPEEGDFCATDKLAGLIRKALNRVVLESSVASRYNSVTLLASPDSRIIMTDVTRILNAIEQGDTGATEKLLPLVYEELRFLAAHKMSHEPPGQTLQATALVHEAYIRLVKARDRAWKSRGHFFRAVAEAMRRILVENARRKKSLKHGAGRQRVELGDSVLIATQEISLDDLLVLNDALDKLSQKDPAAADLVKLHYFAGLTLEQVAGIQEISRRAAVEHLAYARVWLHREITKGNEPISR